MITKKDAERMQPGTTLHHISLKNKDGSPLRGRVNGKVQTWKTKAEDFRLPMKYGLSTYFDITPQNGGEWEVV